MNSIILLWICMSKGRKDTTDVIMRTEREDFSLHGIDKKMTYKMLCYLSKLCLEKKKKITSPGYLFLTFFFLPIV